MAFPVATPTPLVLSSEPLRCRAFPAKLRAAPASRCRKGEYGVFRTASHSRGRSYEAVTIRPSGLTGLQH